MGTPLLSRDHSRGAPDPANPGLNAVETTLFALAPASGGGPALARTGWPRWSQRSGPGEQPLEHRGFYYYISSTSDHQALDPRGGGPLPYSTTHISFRIYETHWVFIIFLRKSKAVLAFWPGNVTGLEKTRGMQIPWAWSETPGRALNFHSFWNL